MNHVDRSLDSRRVPRQYNYLNQGVDALLRKFVYSKNSEGKTETSEREVHFFPGWRTGVHTRYFCTVALRCYGGGRGVALS